MTSQLKTAMTMKMALETNLKDSVDFLNKKLLETKTKFNNQNILSFNKNSILVNILGIKKYSDMTIEELENLNSIIFNMIEDESVKFEINSKIPKLKALLLYHINEFISTKHLYFDFSTYFNSLQLINAYVLDKKISYIFQNNIHLINSKNNSLEIKSYGDLDLLTLSAVYDIINNYMSKNFKSSSNYMYNKLKGTKQNA